MKKSFLLIIVSLLILSCKNEKNNESTDLVRGEFILIENAGVLKGKDFIYGVIIDDMAQELAQKIKPLQREEFDMVPVVIKGIVKPNDQKDGWPEVVEIKEIVGVSEPTSELPTKIKSSSSLLEKSGEKAAEGNTQ